MPSPTDGPFVGGWQDATSDAIGETAEWSNKVELADLNGDGTVDILVANGGDYDTPGRPEPTRAFLNAGDGTFTEATTEIFGDFTGLARVVKARDLNADGHVDILVGTTYDTQSQLFLGSGDGAFVNATTSRLPAATLSLGDLEFGDVDLDGDLDVVLADWGDDGPLGKGGRVNLWLNDGTATFRDATSRMPATLVKFSWDIELLDVDNDWDLDLAVSCKLCAGSYLFDNDGTGAFSETTDRLPAFPNNYEFAPLDLDGDGYLDLVTINDGTDPDRASFEHVFRNDRGVTFVDMTDTWWPPSDNPGFDDNIVVGLDVESDGDADFVIGSLDGPDRLLVNDGTGRLTMATGIIAGDPSGGTLGWGIADLNGDARPDMVESQGETVGHENERVYLAGAAIPPDTAPPIIVSNLGDLPAAVVFARVHDNRTPNMPHDWQAVELRLGDTVVPMTWYGENLFRAEGEPVDGARVCARDAAGNEACAP